MHVTATTHHRPYFPSTDALGSLYRTSCERGNGEEVEIGPNFQCRMTDRSPQIQHNEQLLDVTLAQSQPTGLPSQNGHTASVGASIHAAGPDFVEDDSIIRCICGYSDDDGATVFCEECSTWQHIECYYPSEEVPDVHHCRSCHPRAMDVSAAAQRQRQSRLALPTAERKAKKSAGKSHKKRTKDSWPPSQLNGIPLSDRFARDRTSGSPQDSHAPPAKRAKTGHHRSSNSVTIAPNVNNNHQQQAARRRTDSNANCRASPTKSPVFPNGFANLEDRYSAHLITLYDREWQQTETNSFGNLATIKTLSSWLNDSEQFDQVANGKSQHEVYSRWDKPMDELRRLSPGVRQQRYEDTSVTVHGRHPVYYYLTVDQEAAEGSFLGELNGQITTKKAYEDSSELFPILRHPEPFVFYSDKLPICIDARKEGSSLRYIRRSCHPTARMQIIIIGHEYRFCLVSNQPLLPDAEITIPWYIDPCVIDISRRLTEEKKTVTLEDIEYRAKWVAGVLAHFGECACNRPKDQCIFNLAGMPRLLGAETNGQQARTVKKKIRRATQISPMNTGRAANSRAGSEAGNPLDLDEDAVDSRSVSSSVKSKSCSRDITPLALVGEGSLCIGAELSSREQRKIQEQERLFAQMEQDGTKKKKRNSAGSVLTTPAQSATVCCPGLHQAPPSHCATQKQQGHVEPFLHSPTFAVSSSKQKSNGPPPSGSKLRLMSGSRVPASKPSPVRPVLSYSESSTQTEALIDDGADIRVDARVAELRRSTGCTFAQKLLNRTRKMRARTDVHLSQTRHQRGPTTNLPDPIPASNRGAGDLLARNSPANPIMPPPPLPAHIAKPSTHEVIVEPEPPLPNPQPTPESNSTQPSTSSHDIEMSDGLEDQVKHEIHEIHVFQELNLASMDHDTVAIDLELPSSRIITRSAEVLIPVSEPLVLSPLKHEPPFHGSPDPRESTEVPNEVMSSTTSQLQIVSKSAETPTLTIATLSSPPLPRHDEPHTGSPTTPFISQTALSDSTNHPDFGAATADTPSFVASPLVLKDRVSPVLGSLASSVAPSPLQRKKMSLSDYTNRIKKKRNLEEAQKTPQQSPLSSSAPRSGGIEFPLADDLVENLTCHHSELTPTDTLAPTLSLSSTENETITAISECPDIKVEDSLADGPEIHGSNLTMSTMPSIQSKLQTISTMNGQ